MRSLKAPCDHSIRSAMVLLSVLSGLMLTSCKDRTTEAPEQVWQRELPKEQAARFDRFDWDGLFEEFETARADSNRAPTELRLDRMFHKYWKGIANDYPGNDQRARAAIIKFNEQLARDDIQLLVLWIPNPVDTHATSITGERDPQELSIQPGFTELALDLKEAGIPMIDLRRIFRRAADEQDPDTDPFERYDHHWSSAGIQLAADALADTLLEIQPASQAKDHTSFSFQPRMVPRDFYKRLFSPDFDPGEHEVQEVLVDGAPFTAAKNSRILLIGDSMLSHLSATKDHGVSADFPAHLSARLGYPVSVVKQNGGAQVAPMLFLRDALRRTEDTLPEVVVWVLANGEHNSASWSLTEIPEEIERKRLRKDRTSDDQQAFVGLVQALDDKIGDRITADFAASLDYPDLAVASLFEAVASQDKHAPTPGSKFIVLQSAVSDRKPVPGLIFDLEQYQWMALTPADAAVSANKSLESIQIMNEAEYDVDLPRYWRQ